MPVGVQNQPLVPVAAVAHGGAGLAADGAGRRVTGEQRHVHHEDQAISYLHAYTGTAE